MAKVATENRDSPEEYSEWNEHNLHTLKVIPVNDDYCLMHESHPCIGLLTFNQHVIAVNITTFPRDTKGYLKVSLQVVNVCVSTLKEFLKFQPSQGC